MLGRRRVLRSSPTGRFSGYPYGLLWWRCYVTIMSNTLEQTAIDEAALLDYPLARRKAACYRWAIRTQVFLSRTGCAYILTMHDTDMGDMSRSDRAAAEKVYGALLSDKGCLRRQRSLREQIQNRLADTPGVRLHGPRLFQLMRAGLPFLPIPEEQFVRARQQLNQVLALGRASAGGVQRRVL